MTRPVRFAILGFGLHAVRRLLPAFAKSEQVVLTGMWRRDQAAAAKNCADLGIANCFPTTEALCSSDEVDVVFITSPDAMHLEDTLLALKHGKAVLCEKPLSMHASEAETMLAAADAAGLLLGVAQNFRYNHSLDTMREQILAGRIGEPQSAFAQFNYPADRAPRKWIADPALACGGPIADVGVHCIDSLRYVLGQDVLSLSTLAEAIAGSPVEAHATLQIAMSGGVFATVAVSARSPYRTLIEVTGSEGVIRAESALSVDRPVDVVLRRSGEPDQTHTVDNGDGYTRMLDNFAEAYRGTGTFLATAPDGLHNMRALDAAYKSWKTGNREAI
ncbi:Gfo/Idh/MocA family protein [Granulicella arctica]|uniref:Gfo/Idh/MocA family protein n=1 Tax=Granulicella arctica TaxID=940613 RepID=UPI0021E070BC|nr:Gfo/Idh/MocA family oxidoreductase [Granulicella arctica]